jgi:hypothetical protein
MNDKRAQLDIYGLLRRLVERKIPHRLNSIRDDAIMIEVPVPGERWEIEFFANGEVEIEIFRSDGKIHDAKALDELFTRWSD